MTTAAQEAFLKAFHAERPAVTAEAFAGARTTDGRASSYELLAERVAAHPRVLDLGCGDGHLLHLLARTPGRTLAGADISPQALALARRRPEVIQAGAVLLEARAQQLPFADGAFDAVASHMALMLMGDVEQVAAEIARVLVPGGVLAFVVGAGGRGTAYEVFRELLGEALERTPAERRIPVLGDRRTRDRDAMSGLLAAAGFDPAPDWETLTLDIGGPPERVWTALSGLYDLAALDAGTLAGLRAAFLARTGGPDDDLPCHFGIHLATARKR
ncbi:class I SAM-dependent methyltransferase [Streptomyces sp. NPDC047028]|uniref:class I SAM-dependent methyltransferase n=1 Tax=Streptomyces sp. NPDC047028 TaxID=3155793 RepID=UPI003409BA58